ncbi:MAG: histidinol-phosphate transaminase [Clostridia bacterium]|nr:histidinol-phosphate transaminase [Clostridia bacterium]
MSRFLSRRLENLTPYVPGEQPRDNTQIIKLNTNENPYPPSPRVQAAIASFAKDPLRLYPDAESAELVAAAAGLYGLAPRQVLAGNGSDELLAFAIQAFGGFGLAFPDITYGFYAVWAALFQVKYCQVPVREDFRLALADYADQPGTLLIANPNAPTGIALSRVEIEGLLRQNRNRLVIVDEAYADFNTENALPLLQTYDNLLIIRTLSKSYALAGIRVGLALGSAELIADLRRVKFSFNPYNINRVSEHLAIEALDDQNYFHNCRKLVIAGREQLTADLQRLGFTVLPSRANFVFAGEHEHLAAADYEAALRQRGILVRYFPELRCSGFVRISVGRPQEMTALIEATREILGKPKAGEE